MMTDRRTQVEWNARPASLARDGGPTGGRLRPVAAYPPITARNHARARGKSCIAAHAETCTPPVRYDAGGGRIPTWVR